MESGEKVKNLLILIIKVEYELVHGAPWVVDLLILTVE
jgi:hypothetical protein